jgi:hypothetical protein
MAYTDPDEVEFIGEYTDPDNVDFIGDLGSDPDDPTGAPTGILGGDDDALISGFFDDVVSSVAKVGAGIIKSPITKVVAGATAVVFPPVGIPATAALVVADQAIRVAEGMKGTPKQQAVMKKAIGHTVKVATGKIAAPRALKLDAQRAVSFMSATRKLRATEAEKVAKGRPILEGLFVDKNGRVTRGRFAKV